MATWEDVRRLAAAMPEVTETESRGTPRWHVRGKRFVWERTLRRRDLEELGDAAPDGPILGAAVPDEGVKAALVAEEPDVYFTTSHFDGYPVILVRLDRIERQELEELVTEAWITQAPKHLAEKFLA